MSLNKKSIVITSAVRTAVGTFNGALKNMKANQLGSVVIKEAIKIAKKVSDSAISGLKAVVKAHDNALVSSLDEQLEYERDTQEIFCNKEEFREGVRAFREKRKPNFKDIDAN